METAILPCPWHGMTEHAFYSGRYRCKKCYTWYNAEKRKRFKKILIDYKGGKCEICGYDKCQSALEFHHIDESKKSFAISESAFSHTLKELKEEADKCMLLCANCHREIHAKENEENLNDIGTYRRLRETLRRAYKKIDKSVVEKLIAEGKKQSDIAKEIGVSLSTLKRFLSDNGMSKKRI